MFRSLSLTILFTLSWFLVAERAAAADLSDYYKIENIPLPEGESSVDGVAFLPDGRLACCLSLSKVFIYDPASKKWSLFAEGLHTPLGLLALGNREIIVMQRPEMTKLTDTDGDGRADQFKTLSDDFGLSSNYAEFAFGPVKDSEGNLFFSLGTGSGLGKIITPEVRGLFSPIGNEGRMNSSVPYRGWVMKLTPEGETIPWANGFREPNGLGFDLQGNLFVPDNQGDFVGSSALFHVRKGGFYGHPHSLIWRQGFNRHPFEIPVAELDTMRSRPAVVFPHGEMSNSPARPIADTTMGKFGPFAGQMFLGEMNFPRLLRVMFEEIDGQFQGAVVPFFDKAGLPLGNNRFAFHPDDGSLWVGGTKHKAWVGASGLHRLSWTGRTPMEVERMSLTKDGFDLTFTLPVNGEAAKNPGHYTLESYTYNYHEAYGSEKFDRTKEPVTSVSVSPDRRTVSLKLDKLKPWRIYDLRIKGVTSENGLEILHPWVVYTLNRLKGGATPDPETPRKKPTPRRNKAGVPEGGVKSVGGPQDFTTLEATSMTPPRPNPKLPGGGIQLIAAPQESTTSATNSKVKVHSGEGHFRFSEDGQNILVYNSQPISREDGSYKRAHYVHPLHGLDGVRMTDDMPADHPHHRGIFWSWMQLWIGDQRIGVPWEQKGIDWEVRDVRISSDQTSSAIESEVLWTSPHYTDKEGTPKPIIEEQVIIRVHEKRDDSRLIDFEIALRALQKDVRLGGSENSKGYGGFSVRIPLPEDLQMVGPEGKESVNWKKPTSPQPWIDFTADFGKKGKTSGLAILCHPSHPKFPLGWTLRLKDSCQNPVFPGRETITVPMDEPLVLRYRIVLHRGDTDQADIAGHFREYAEEKPTK